MNAKNIIKSIKNDNSISKDIIYYLLNYEGSDKDLIELKKSYFISKGDPYEILRVFNILQEKYNISESLYYQNYPILSYLKKVKNIDLNVESEAHSIHSLLSYLCLYKPEEVSVELLETLEELNFNFEQLVGMSKNLPHHVYIVKVNKTSSILWYFDNFKLKEEFFEKVSSEMRTLDEFRINSINNIVNDDLFTIELIHKNLLNTNEIQKKYFTYKNEIVISNDTRIINYCKKRNFKFMEKNHLADNL